jgi:hypothetical protein
LIASAWQKNAPSHAQQRKSSIFGRKELMLIVILSEKNAETHDFEPKK